MTVIRPKFAAGEFYHIYNRGVAKQPIFHDAQDYQRFLLTLGFYLEQRPERRLSFTTRDQRARILTTEPKKPLAEICSYCFMPNHFHITVRQLTDEGVVTTFIRRTLDSYTKAYNTRYHRVGPLFQGRSQAVLVSSDSQLLHLTRYHHLNPYVAKLVDRPEDYPWSSYRHYLNSRSDRLCHPGMILAMIGSPEEYRRFVEDYASYARDLAAIKDLLIDGE